MTVIANNLFRTSAKGEPPNERVTTKYFWKIWSGLMKAERNWFTDFPRKVPVKSNGGAQLTVRESQAGVFFYKGKAIEAFGPWPPHAENRQHSHPDQDCQSPLGHEQPFKGRDVLRQHEGLYQPQVGHKGSGGLQGFRIGPGSSAGVWGL